MTANTSTAVMAGKFKALRPPGGFRVILADPPWLFETFSAKGLGKSAQRHYDCMPTEEIAAMPVELLAAKDCTLFIWCTWPLLSDWEPVINAWGFKFTGLAWEWIKFNPETGKHAFGGGYGTRKNLEPCLLATRGRPSLRKGYAADLFSDGHEPEGVRSVRDFIYAMPGEALHSRRREHSQKPDEQYKRIETMFDGPYVELFSRQKRPGWISWGNQTDKFPSLERT